MRPPNYITFETLSTGHRVQWPRREAKVQDIRARAILTRMLYEERAVTFVEGVRLMATASGRCAEISVISHIPNEVLCTLTVALRARRGALLWDTIMAVEGGTPRPRPPEPWATIQYHLTVGEEPIVRWIKREARAFSWAWVDMVAKA